MARAYGADAVYAFGKESTYGTPPASGNFFRMPFNSCELGSSRPLVSDPVLGQGRDPYAPQQDVITVDGSVTVPVDLRYFGLWLSQIFGAPVSVDQTTNWKHTWKSGAASLPSHAAEIQHTKVGDYFMNSGVVVDTLEMSFQRSGFANATMQLIAQGEAKASSSSAGTLDEMDYTPFNRFQGAIKQGGVSVANLLEGSLQYANNYERVETIRADGKIDGADPTQAALTGSLRARYSDDSLFDSANAGTPIDLEFSYVISATQKLVLTAHEVYLPKPRLSVSGPNGIDATFDFQGAKNAVAGCMLTVELYNDQDDTVY